MSGVSTPILSKKQQNKSIANKKKSTKAIRNVLTCKSATHWPLITDESEKSSLINILRSMTENVSKARTERGKHNKNNDLKDIRQYVKFGINEIDKHLTKDDCQAILLDADIPRVLPMHVISTALSKSVPLLCIQGLTKTLNECFGFKSSSVCFTNMILSKKHSNLPKITTELCDKYFIVNKNDNTTVDIEKPNEIAEDVFKITDTSLDYIKLEENKIIIGGDLRGRKSKKSFCYRNVLIKRIRMNEDRQINR